jgi:hypothetical protein
MTDQTDRLRAVFTVTVETKPGGDYYYDHDDLVRNVTPWIEGALEDRDDIRDVTIAEQESAVPAPATDQAVLRDRIAEAIHADLLATAYRRDQGLLGIVPRLADAVLAVLPATVDRAAVLREAADRYEAILASAAAEHSSDPRYYTGVRDVILGLRRLAGEAQLTQKPCPDHNPVPNYVKGGTVCASCGEDRDGRMPAEAQQDPTQDGEARAGQPDTDEETPGRQECAHCWREVENHSEPNMCGPAHDNWVHVPGGFTVCFPQRGADSPRAEPAPPPQ